MERRGHRQQHAALDPVRLHQRNRALDRSAVAGQHDLPRIVVVGDRADLTFRRSGGQRRCLLDIRAEQRTHRAHTHRHGGLHGLTAQAQQPRGIGERKRPGGAQRGIFAQAVARDELRLVRERKAAFLFEHAQHGNGIGHDRGLGIGGERQRILGPAGHQREEVLLQRIIDFLKHFARGGAGGGKLCPHTDFLTALPRKNKCPHHCTPLEQRA